MFWQYRHSATRRWQQRVVGDDGQAAPRKSGRRAERGPPSIPATTATRIECSTPKKDCVAIADTIVRGPVETHCPPRPGDRHRVEELLLRPLVVMVCWLATELAGSCSGFVWSVDRSLPTGQRRVSRSEAGHDRRVETLQMQNQAPRPARRRKSADDPREPASDLPVRVAGPQIAHRFQTHALPRRPSLARDAGRLPPKYRHGVAKQLRHRHGYRLRTGTWSSPAPGRDVSNVQPVGWQAAQRMPPAAVPRPGFGPSALVRRTSGSTSNGTSTMTGGWPPEMRLTR